MATEARALVTGALYGGALTAAGIWSPQVIFDQLSLRNNHMLSVFVSASACSTVLIYVARRSGYAALPGRSNSSTGRLSGLLGAYDANIVGGLLQGLGMALAGACPGSGIVQLALGVEKATFVLVGGITGALAYMLVADSLTKRESNVKKTTVKHTVQDNMEINTETAMAGYEVLLTGALLGLVKFGSSRGPYTITSPVLGGAAVGLAQAGSIVLAKKTVGISTAYSEVAAIIGSLAQGHTIKPALNNIVFAVGLAGGAKLMALALDIRVDQNTGVSTAAAVLGGFVSLFGARLAGGCTSGHGISGMSTLSISSFITMAGLFGGGIIFRQILNRP